MSPKESFPKDFEEKSKEQFSKMAKPEITFQQYLEFEKQEFLRQEQLKKNPKLRYRPPFVRMTACGNGDFETGLNPIEWHGAYGSVPYNGVPDFSTFTAGLYSPTGSITDPNSRQTLVSSPAVDPYVNIPVTAHNSLHAVRIGNAVNNRGCELLSKTFVVTAAQSYISFWYAVVLQDPGHNLANQPYFWGRVTKMVSGVATEIPGVFNFGNGSSKLVADHSDPFFLQKNVQGVGPVLYRDWSCAQINLSGEIGNTVTIEFVTQDCNYGGHWGYAYLDNFCGACKWCCPGPSLLTNGDFEAGNNGFSSQYTFVAATTPNAVLPGQYNIVTSAQALSISPDWVATDHYICKGGTGTSKFMVINGKTCQSGSKAIWKTTATVVGGKEYRFCANAKHLKQATFDIKPVIEVKFSLPSGAIVPSSFTAPITVNTGTNACDWLSISGSVTAPAGSTSLVIELWLDERGVGDGNDLALDDISLQPLFTMDPSCVWVDIQTTSLPGNKYNISANPVNLPANYGYWWEICELDNNLNVKPNTTVTNLPTWWTIPCVFNGYNGTPGVFDMSKIYRITFGAWSECVAWRSRNYVLQYNIASKAVKVSPVQQSEQDFNAPVAYRANKITGGTKDCA